MNPKLLSIYLDPKNSLNIFREEVLSIFQNIALQHYNTQKHKVNDLTLHVKSHRLILFHKTQLDLYFEVHFDNIVDGIISIKRGVFRREVYKIQFFYRGNQMFELKYANRQCFEEVSNTIVTAFNNSKKIVGLEGEEYKHGEDFRKRGL